MGLNYNKIFNIPSRSLNEVKITKAFFLSSFDLTTTDKNVLNYEIQSMQWLASIKPTNANISAEVNDMYNYEEIQVMVCTLKGLGLQQFGDKCVQLFQKYIPYPILLIIEDEDNFMINTCDKRINQNDTNKRTIEKHISTPILTKLYKDDLVSTLFDGLNFTALDKTNLETVYKSYIKAIVNYQTALVTGATLVRNHTRTEDDMQMLEQINKLEKEVIRLTNQIKKESQFNTKLNMNIEIQKHRKEIESIKNKLGQE